MINEGYIVGTKINVLHISFRVVRKFNNWPCVHFTKNHRAWKYPNYLKLVVPGPLRALVTRLAYVRRCYILCMRHYIIAVFYL